MSVGEPQRSQYLDAMGLSVWASRYRLPNVRPTARCEWQGEAPSPPRPPAQRLQALLAEQTPAEAVAPPPVAAEPVAESAPRRARALLVSKKVVTPEAPASERAAPAPASHAASSEALRFSLQVAALDGRWLVLLPGRQPLDAIHRRLLDNLLRAAGIEPGRAPQFQTFEWPMMEGQPAESPLDEARDGLRAFVEGRRRRGWRPERLLLFGADETLERVLELREGHCRLLDLPGWQGPELSALAQSGRDKRALLPWLETWRRAWHEGASEQAGAERDDLAT